MVEERRLAVRRLLQENSLDAFCFWSPTQIRFLCGFTGSDAVLVVTADRAVFLSDGRYTTQAARQVQDAELRTYTRKVEAVAALLEESSCLRVGVEGEVMAVATLEKLKEKTPSVQVWRPLAEELRGLRCRKQPAELDAVEAAARLNAEAFEAVLPGLQPGVTERNFALQLEFELKRRGAEEKAFDFIVASGERGALPHGIATERVIRSGELVTIDFGVRCRGYHSDETVTVAVGQVEARLREVFETVLEAHDRALAAVKPGVKLAELDGIARRWIEDCGYGEYFGHGLGHGVGLEVHEPPTVSGRSSEVAEEGMIFTIEPGIYIPELGGVRIEDMVLVTATGGRVLTSVPKTFRTV